MLVACKVEIEMEKSRREQFLYPTLHANLKDFCTNPSSVVTMQNGSLASQHAATCAMLEETLRRKIQSDDFI